MSEVSAATGLTSLRSIDDFVAVNRRNYGAYRRLLAGIPGMKLFAYDEVERCNFQYVVVEYTAAPGGPTRDDLVRALWAENVMARKYFWPGCHRMEPYRTLYPRAAARRHRTDARAAELLILPAGSGVWLGDIARLGSR